MNRSLEPVLLRPGEVATILGIARSRAYHMCATGELPTVKIGRSVRVALDDLRRFVDERRTEPITTDG